MLTRHPWDAVLSPLQVASATARVDGSIIIPAPQ